MRLWSIHPSSLDRARLVALWREGLCGRAVIYAPGRGYHDHPAWARFRTPGRSLALLDAYLHAVCDEADRRGYRFRRDKLGARVRARLTVPSDQLAYERAHLARKTGRWVPPPGVHPLFTEVPGPVAPWERPAAPWLVGMNNPYTADPRYALWPDPPAAAGGRLARILGLAPDDYVRLTDRRNLCVGPFRPGPARDAAAALVAEAGTAPVVLLGAQVARAFGVAFRPFSRPRPGLVILPHPSGLCRVWNDPGAASRARAVVRAEAPHLGLPG